jgi:hypothetical protein
MIMHFTVMRLILIPILILMTDFMKTMVISLAHLVWAVLAAFCQVSGIIRDVLQIVLMSIVLVFGVLHLQVLDVEYTGYYWEGLEEDGGIG